MRVGLFVTCLVDLMRPSIGFAAIKLLESGGAEVFVPPTQTCCGQPGYNSGDRAGATALASKLVAEFEGLRLSRRAVGLVQRHDSYALRRPVSRRPGHASSRGGAWRQDARTDRFPGQRAEAASVPGKFAGKVTYHDCCAGLREMDVKQQPRVLLAKNARRRTDRNGRLRNLLWLRRHVLDQVRRHFVADGRQQVPAHRRHRRRRRRARRPRLRAQHRRPLRRRGDTTTRVLHIAEVAAGVDP